MEFIINPKEPIYTQIINYMKKQIIKGLLKGGDRILSVRECASELKVNPNTIQRAYTELEDDGLIYTQRGIGKFVVDDKGKVKELQIDMLKEVVDNFIRETKDLGVSKDDIISILNERYNWGGNKLNNVVEATEIYKSLGGKEILKGISLTLAKGRVLGVLGPNGQGKTTLLNVLSGFLKANTGDIKIDNLKVSVESKKIVSFLQEKSNLSRWMSVNDAIGFYSDFFQDFDNEKMENLLEVMKIDKKIKVKNLSKGMLEKLCLSLTLSRKAKLFILDEPISGVDLITREKIVDTIIDNIDGESSMIITTHYVGELERVFDEVAFLGDGKILEHGDAEDLRIKYGKSIEDIYKEIFAE